MTTDDKTPDPTPALLSTARLAEIRERVSYTVIAEAHNEAIADRAALLSHLDALTPRDREQGGRLVREVWIAWAKEQPAPKASWLVEWEGLSEPDREVDRRIFEACYAAGRASLTPHAPVDGEALGRRLLDAITDGLSPTFAKVVRDLDVRVPGLDVRLFDRAALALHAIGYAAGRSEGEAERARLSALLAAEHESAGVAIEGQAAEIARVTEECDAERVAVLDRDATIARLTAERDAARSEAHAAAEAMLVPKIELATMGLRAELDATRADAATDRLLCQAATDHVRDREEMITLLREQVAERDASLRTETTMKEQVQDQLVEMRGKHREEWERTERLAGELAEAHDRATAFGVTVVESTEREAQKKIDALAAELAEARAARPHEPIADAALLAAKLYHDADNQSVQLAQIRVELDACRQEVAAARLDGAREEREAIETFLRAEMRNSERAGQAEEARALYDALEWSRARGEAPMLPTIAEQITAIRMRPETSGEQSRALGDVINDFRDRGLL